LALGGTCALHMCTDVRRCPLLHSEPSRKARAAVVSSHRPHVFFQGTSGHAGFSHRVFPPAISQKAVLRDAAWQAQAAIPIALLQAPPAQSSFKACRIPTKNMQNLLGMLHRGISIFVGFVPKRHTILKRQSCAWQGHPLAHGVLKAGALLKEHDASNVHNTLISQAPLIQRVFRPMNLE
jgi:hypothetical protein